MLGAPLFKGPHLGNALALKRAELERLSTRLVLMAAHDSLFLLRNLLAMPRLLYKLRTASCINSPELSPCNENARYGL